MKLRLMLRGISGLAMIFLIAQCGTLAGKLHAADDLSNSDVEREGGRYGASITDQSESNGAVSVLDAPHAESVSINSDDAVHANGDEVMELVPPSEDTLEEDAAAHSIQMSAVATSIDSESVVVVDPPVFIMEDLPQTELIIEQECEPCDPSEETVSFGDWLGYNSAQSSTSWLAGDQMGMFSLESYPSLDLGSDSALVVGTGFHFLNGPKATDMPPRLFDLIVGYHGRRAISDDDFIDAKFGVGVFSDFEGSARKGVRYPGHAVSYHRWYPDFISVFGVEVLDRDDIAALPVGGVVFRCADDLLFELVFPRPRIQLRVSDETAMYVAGELGGSTWAIERIDRRNDNATYRDLRITFGVTDFGEESEGVLEFGLAFDRSLEYRSKVGNRDLDSTFLLRCHVHY